MAAKTTGYSARPVYVFLHRAEAGRRKRVGRRQPEHRTDRADRGSGGPRLPVFNRRNRRTDLRRERQSFDGPQNQSEMILRANASPLIHYIPTRNNGAQRVSHYYSEPISGKQKGQEGQKGQKTFFCPFCPSCPFCFPSCVPY